MKKIPEIFTIFVIYLLSVPTNVMCLGSFTESWLNNYSISRSGLSFLYLFSTIAVFFVMIFFKHIYSTKKTFLCLSSMMLILVSFPSNTAVLFLFFLLLQWLGQGCLVSQCRCRLFAIVSAQNYGRTVGFLEAMGTCAVFLCPFLLLFFIHKWSWQISLYSLALIYGSSAFFFKMPQETSESNAHTVYRDAKFWLANLIIHLPVILFSGLFFHLEGVCRTYGIPLKTWEHITQIQVPGIVIGQIFFGCLWRNHIKNAMFFLLILVLSQVVWLANLFYFNLIVCVICGIVGWSLFGVLVNAFWGCLYREQLLLVDEGIRASVAFGFLANAIGPILFCLFL